MLHKVRVLYDWLRNDIGSLLVGSAVAVASAFLLPIVGWPGVAITAVMMFLVGLFVAAMILRMVTEVPFRWLTKEEADSIVLGMADEIQHGDLSLEEAYSMMDRRVGCLYLPYSRSSEGFEYNKWLYEASMKNIERKYGSL